MTNSILVKVPLRISLLGGGTDFLSYYKKSTGRVLSFAINKYIYILIKELNDYFDENYRLNYFVTERVNSINEISNDITRESLSLQQYKNKLYISTIADIPQSSGLGSSSSFAVGLNLALRAIQGKKIDKNLVVRDAIDVELLRLKKPIGIQDQIAAGYGGINYIEFSTNYKDHYKVNSIDSRDFIKELTNNSLLVWTGKHRSADKILSDQEKNKDINFESLKSLSDLTEEYVKKNLSKFKLEDLANAMNESWEIKKRLSNMISDNNFDRIYNLALKSGAIGGKLLGAGGGGFFLFIVKKSEQKKFKNSMEDYKIENFSISFEGAQIINKNF